MKNENNIFDNTGCLNINVLEDYVNNLLEPDTERLVEKHLTDCEMCSEMVDGLVLLNNTNKHKSINKINTGIDRIINKDKEVKIVPLYKRYYFAIAASLFFVLISFFLLKNLFNKPKQDLAELKPIKQEQIEEKNNLIKEATEPATINEEGKSGKLKADSIYRGGKSLADNERLNKDILDRLTTRNTAQEPDQQTVSTIGNTNANDEIAFAASEKNDISTVAATESNNALNTKTLEDADTKAGLNEQLAFNQAPAKAEAPAEESEFSLKVEAKKRERTKAKSNDIPATGTAASNTSPTYAYTDNSLKKSAEKDDRKENEFDADKKTNSTNQSICDLIDNQKFKEAKILNDATLRTNYKNIENEYFKLLIEIIYQGEYQKNNQLKDYFNPKFKYWQQAMLFWAYNAKDLNKVRLSKDLAPLLKQKNSIYAQKAQQYLDNLKD